MIGALAGGLLGAGGSIAGGLISAEANRRNVREQLRLSEDMARQGITWRVEDAKRAGLHPLFALGFNPGTHIPTVIGDTVGPAIAEAGQSLGSAFSRMSTDDDKRTVELQNRLLESQIGESDARRMAIYSDIANRGQAAQVGGLGLSREVPGLPEGQVPAVPDDWSAGWYQTEAPRRMSASMTDPAGEPGVSPAWEMVQYPGFKMMMPSGRGQESPMEIWSELPAYEKWGWIMHNAYKQGPKWLDKYVSFMLSGATGQERFPKPLLPMDDTEKALQREIQKGLDAGRRWFPKTWKDLYKERR